MKLNENLPTRLRTDLRVLPQQSETLLLSLNLLSSPLLSVRRLLPSPGDVTFLQISHTLQ